MCKNLETTMQVKTKLKQPVHLKTPMGQTYIKRTSSSPIGDMSFHFDEKRPYIDFTNTPKDQLFANGTHPTKIYFMEGWGYSEEERMFYGRISFNQGGGHYKDSDS